MSASTGGALDRAVDAEDDVALFLWLVGELDRLDGLRPGGPDPAGAAGDSRDGRAPDPSTSAAGSVDA